MKKTISVLLTISIILSLFVGLSITSSAYGGYFNGKNNAVIYWSLDPDSGILEIWGDAEMGTTSPHYLGSVNGDKLGGFIKTVYVKENIKTISAQAFKADYGYPNPYNMKTAFIAPSVTKIEAGAFASTALKEIYIYSDTITIAANAIPSNATIYGYADTQVETFAKQNEYAFVALCREHTPVLTGAKEATCEETGYTGDMVCSACGAIVEQGSIIKELGHNYQLQNASSPDCITTGYTGDSVCSRCGAIESTGETIPELGHLFGEWQIIKTPTCKEIGSKIRFCSRCNNYETDYIPPINHIPVVDAAVEATCTETGLTEGTHCSLCGEPITKQDVIPALGHDYNEIVTNPTCTEKGYITYTCSRCNDSYTDSYTDSLGHDYIEQTVNNPTCLETGTCKISCSRCDYQETKNIPALGHDFGEWTQTLAPTCTQNGQEERVCKRDGSHKENREVAKLGHKYSKSTVKETSINIGYTIHKCSRCEDQYFDSFKAPTGKIGGFKCKARTSAAQTLIWNNVKTATGYQVQISTKDGKKWSTSATLKAGTTAYTFKNLAAGNNYKFRVRFYIAKDGTNYYSPWSSTLTSPTLPTGTTITKLTPAKKAFTAQWKKNASVNGYQVQYSLKSNFSGAKTITVKSPKTLKAVAKKLNAGKYYYVRIRTYKTISKVNYFSAWSKTYKMKTK